MLGRSLALETAARLVERGRYDEAIVHYRGLVEVDPRDSSALLKLGDLQCRVAAYAEAIVTYQRLGEVFARDGHARKAIAVFTKARSVISTHTPELEDFHRSIVLTLAELYRGLELTHEALAAIDDCARHLEGNGKDLAAIPLLRKATELDPCDPLRRLRLAEALSRADDADGAATELGVAASQLVGIGRTDEALTVIERLLHHRKDAEFARLAASLYLARETEQDAVHALTKLQLCVRADATDVEALRLVARAFGLIGHREKAAEVERQIATIAGEPQSISVRSESSLAGGRDSEDAGPIPVIPVTAQAWDVISTRLGQEGGEREQLVAFVRSQDDRSTMRTIYGVLKIVFE